MKNRTPVKLEVGAPEPSRSVRVIVLTDQVSAQIRARVQPRKRLKLQTFRSHRFVPVIQLRSMGSPRTSDSGSDAAWQHWLDVRHRHRTNSFS